MTCKWCGDEKTMYWDETERGCPPPPIDWHDEVEDWDRMEASLRYDNNRILLGDETLKVTIPCPVCIGFGRARNEPFCLRDSAIDKEQPPGLQHLTTLTPEDRWNRLYAYMLAFREIQAGLATVQLQRQYTLARQHWLKCALAREKFRNDLVPDWPKMPDDVANGGLCPSCGSGNFAPTRHPRTGDLAVGCCECGIAWVYAEQPVPKEAEIERRKLEVAGLRHSLQHSFLLSPGEAEMLLASYGYDLVDRISRRELNIHFHN